MKYTGPTFDEMAGLGPPKPDCGYCKGRGVVGDGMPWFPYEACHCRNWKSCSTCNGTGRLKSTLTKGKGQ